MHFIKHLTCDGGATGTAGPHLQSRIRRTSPTTPGQWSLPTAAPSRTLQLRTTAPPLAGPSEGEGTFRTNNIVVKATVRDFDPNS